jgi:hypothetical protein
LLLGVHLTLLIGPTIAVPAPLPLTEALAGVEVTQNETGRSGFQLTFQVGRSGPFDLLDYNLLTNPLLRPFSRVVVMVLFDLTPTVLIDGFITQIQLTPSEEPGASILSVTGEDVSVMMDLQQITFPYPAMPEIAQVAAILAKYPMLGWMGAIILPPIVPDFPLPTREIPVQNSTDYQHLSEIAAKHGYVFYVRPGPLPNFNIPYWGPRVPLDAIAGAALNPALSVNMGPQTNVNSVNFTYDALAPEMITGEVVDPDLNIPLPVIFPPISTDVPLAPIPGAIFQLMRTRISRMDLKPPKNEGQMSEADREKARVAYGFSVVQAYERARAQVNDSANRVVTVSGELDALRYGSVLQARTVVGLRGAGFTYDGFYFVKSVTHSIRKGEYKQRFTMRREGVGPMSPVVRP